MMFSLRRIISQVSASRKFSALTSFETCSSAPQPSSLKDVHCVDDFQRLASGILPKDVYEYLASGSDDEQTLRCDRSGFRSLALIPRAMKDVSHLTSTVTNFCGTGHDLSLPVFASPAGVHALVHTEGECATAVACGNVGTVFGHSQHATKCIEDVALAAPGAQRWYQAYILKNRSDTYQLLKRAVSSGVTGVFVTVDSVRFGFREADARNGFNGLPDGLDLANYRQIRSRNTSQVDREWDRREHAAWDQNTEALFAEDLSWNDISRLREVLDEICSSSGRRNIPLIVKGIMCAEDATAAIQAGATGVMVSTHGGRQLDSTLGAVEALPDVVRAVRNIDDSGNTPVLLDSGIRRGTDVVKALALGATAVGVGRPLFFALAVAGIPGVERMFEILHNETEIAMALCGCRTVEDIRESHVQSREQR